MKKICRVLTMAAMSACAADENVDEAVEVEVSESGGPCGNGMWDPTELCVTHPGMNVLPTNAQVRTVLAVDVNADGRRDIVAVTAQRVWVRFGAPNNALGATVAVSTVGADYTDVAAGDFDGDGDLDLAATDLATDRLIAWRNNGGAAFSLWDTWNVTDPVRVVAEQLDNNARADVVVLTTGQNHMAALFRADGTPFDAGTFSPVFDAKDIAHGDCDGDGDLDLIYATGSGTSAMLNARRNVNGVFGAPIVSPFVMVDNKVGYLQPFMAAAADFNNDGFSDVAVSASHSRLLPATSNGNCTFTPKFTADTMLTTFAWARSHLRTVDWNGDGNVDIGAPHGVLGGDGDEAYTLVFGDGSGKFPLGYSEQFDPDDVIPKDLAFWDMSGDGRLDVLIAGENGVVLQRRIP